MTAEKIEKLVQWGDAELEQFALDEAEKAYSDALKMSRVTGHGVELALDGLMRLAAKYISLGYLNKPAALHAYFKDTSIVQLSRDLRHLSALREKQGDLKATELLLTRALELKLESLGAAHEETIEVLQDAALLLQTQGRSAESLYALAFSKKRGEGKTGGGDSAPSDSGTTGDHPESDSKADSASDSALEQNTGHPLTDIEFLSGADTLAADPNLLTADAPPVAEPELMPDSGRPAVEPDPLTGGARPVAERNPLTSSPAAEPNSLTVSVPDPDKGASVGSAAAPDPSSDSSAGETSTGEPTAKSIRKRAPGAEPNPSRRGAPTPLVNVAHRVAQSGAKSDAALATEPVSFDAVVESALDAPTIESAVEPVPDAVMEPQVVAPSVIAVSEQPDDFLSEATLAQNEHASDNLVPTDPGVAAWWEPKAQGSGPESQSGLAADSCAQARGYDSRNYQEPVEDETSLWNYVQGVPVAQEEWSDNDNADGGYDLANLVESSGPDHFEGSIQQSLYAAKQDAIPEHAPVNSWSTTVNTVLSEKADVNCGGAFEGDAISHEWYRSQVSESPAVGHDQAPALASDEGAEGFSSSHLAFTTAESKPGQPYQPAEREPHLIFRDSGADTWSQIERSEIAARAGFGTVDSPPLEKPASAEPDGSQHSSAGGCCEMAVTALQLDSEAPPNGDIKVLANVSGDQAGAIVAEGQSLESISSGASFKTPVENSAEPWYADHTKLSALSATDDESAISSFDQRSGHALISSEQETSPNHGRRYDSTKSPRLSAIRRGKGDDGFAAAGSFDFGGAEVEDGDNELRISLRANRYDVDQRSLFSGQSRVGESGSDMVTAHSFDKPASFGIESRARFEPVEVFGETNSIEHDISQRGEGFAGSSIDNVPEVVEPVFPSGATGDTPEIAQRTVFRELTSGTESGASERADKPVIDASAGGDQMKEGAPSQNQIFLDLSTEQQDDGTREAWLQCLTFIQDRVAPCIEDEQVQQVAGLNELVAKSLDQARDHVAWNESTLGPSETVSCVDWKILDDLSLLYQVVSGTNAAAYELSLLYALSVRISKLGPNHADTSLTIQRLYRLYSVMGLAEAASFVVSIPGGVGQSVVPCSPVPVESANERQSGEQPSGAGAGSRGLPNSTDSGITPEQPSSFFQELHPTDISTLPVEASMSESPTQPSVNVAADLLNELQQNSDAVQAAEKKLAASRHILSQVPSDEALPYIASLLALARRHLGEEHLETAACSLLAGVINKGYDSPQFEHCFENAFNIRLKQLGPLSAETAAAAYEFAAACKVWDDSEQGRLRSRAVATCSMVYGLVNTRTIKIIPPTDRRLVNLEFDSPPVSGTVTIKAARQSKVILVVDDPQPRSDPERAEVLRQASSQLERNRFMSPDFPQVSESIYEATSLYGKLDDASKVWTNPPPLEHIVLSMLLEHQGLKEMDRFNYKEASHIFNVVHKVRLRCLPAGHPDLALNQLRRGLIAAYQDNLNLAEELYLLANDALEPIREQQLFLHAAVLHNLGALHLRRGALTPAERLFERAAGQLEKITDVVPQLKICRDNLQRVRKSVSPS